MVDHNKIIDYNKHYIIKKNSTLDDLYKQFINIEKHKQAYKVRLKRFWDNFNTKTKKEQTDERTFWKKVANDMEKDIGTVFEPEYLMVIHEVGYDPSLPRQPHSPYVTRTSSHATSTQTGISLRTTYNDRVSPTYRNTGTSGTSGTKKRSSTTRS
jgi:hypothetical protein